MSIIRDRYSPGYSTPVRLSGVLVEFDADGFCLHPSPEQLEAVAATPTRRERFEIVVEPPLRRRRREPAGLVPEIPQPGAPTESSIVEEPSA